MRLLAAVLRNEGFSVELHEPDGDDPLGGVIDVSGAFGLVQVVSFVWQVSGGDTGTRLAADDVRIRPGGALRLVPIAQLVALKLYAGGQQDPSPI